jgi:large subunit ribosomal protein L4
MQLTVYNTDMQATGTLEVPAGIFDAKVLDGVLWEQVKAQLASRRRGTHSTKSRAEVSGTGKKPFKQKGGGRARQGSLRAPHYVGGGACMAPRPRDYAYRLPRSARRSALTSALTTRAQDDAVVVLSGFSLDVPKTKAAGAFLAKLGSQRALVVDCGNRDLQLSMRNLQKSRYIDAQGLNVYDILNHDKLVLTEAAVHAVVARVKGQD